ncbi:dual specificity protein phosphatase 22 isoform X1 [Phocoena sinus]|nr:dual specificity protein phosphatase 22 isoform X1 [Phocoena sinus]
MGNGMNKILPGLYIGSFKDARDAEQLSKNQVTHILSVHDSARPALEGVKYLCIPAADSPSQNLARHFKESIQFIHECRLRGEGCLVHCLAGVSRSVTLVVAYIMTVTDFGWEDALRTVRAGRSCANPNLGFQRQLQEFEEHQVCQFRQWLKEEYGESPLRDAEEARGILATPGILKYWASLRRLQCTCNIAKPEFRCYPEEKQPEFIFQCPEVICELTCFHFKHMQLCHHVGNYTSSLTREGFLPNSPAVAPSSPVALLPPGHLRALLPHPVTMW